MSSELSQAEQDVMDGIKILKNTVSRLKIEQDEEIKRRLLKEALKTVFLN